MTPTFWAGKRVFLTGHTGFKGAWLTLWLAQLGAPYSRSKGAAELVTAAYAHSFFETGASKCNVASVRAGNVIGGGHGLRIAWWPTLCVG
jgi:nucleoside-diphosphate-sugar epimerase